MKRQKHPSDIYYKILSVIRFCSRTIGVDIIAEDYKINPNTCFVIAAIVAYYLFAVHMVGKYVLKDWTVLLDVFSPVSCTTQGAVKLMSALLYPQLYRKLAMNIGQIYEKYQQMGREYEKKLLEWNKNMKKILIACAVVYSLTALLILSTPIVMYILKGERHLILLCQVPGFEVDSYYGYWVNNAFSLICVMIAAFGLYAALKINDLHKLIEDDDKEERQTKLVNDIVEWHQYYLE
nr:uncharacterized protein LOC118680014 [Bactrocera oleae]